MKNVFYNSWVAKTALCLSKCHTIMLFGFVFSKLKEKEVTQRVRNHECVHVRQWFEVTALSGSVLLAIVLVFDISPLWMLLSGGIYYVWYVLEWMCKSVWYSVLIDKWACLLVCFIEGCSIINNILKPKGLSLDVKKVIEILVGKKLNVNLDGVVKEDKK